MRFGVGVQLSEPLVSRGIKKKAAVLRKFTRKKYVKAGKKSNSIWGGRMDCNFFNYVIEYRVEEAQQRLLDPDASQITMLELAYDIGFNSLSAFNTTTFKKHAGLSPSEFKKQNSQG